MAKTISRRRLAKYIADKFENGQLKNAEINQVAAYLIESGQTRDLDMIVRAVEDELQARGIVVAKVTTAHPLSKAVRQQIESIIEADKVYLKEEVDPGLIGGFKLELPDSQLDETVKNKLMSLRAQKI